ncbi:Phytochrome A [Sesamum angolense]|uniref:Phytochrome A n=1 Tax=Sesamum angolense TaxID=2727404 RepID=A0AAE1W3J5_9LAMI|nr:Phytochrome A [Sesamum angolense]
MELVPSYSTLSWLTISIFEIEILSSQSGKPSAYSTKSGYGARVIAQTSIDAKLQAEFEESGSSFDYSSLVRVVSVSYEEQRPLLSDATSTYLHQIQKEVFELNGYDREMAYKFHDDDHREVFGEITKPNLEPYLGLHYPAIDLPQAAHYLFMKKKELELENQNLEKNILRTDPIVRYAIERYTFSIHDVGFPGVLALGDTACGIATVKITDKDWGGGKHIPKEKDDGRKMHLRSSFQVFLEVVKRRCLSWNDYEMDNIDSLQLILRNTFKEVEAKDSNTKEIHMKFNDLKIDGIQELKQCHPRWSA